ncbi:MAG: DUF6345 domain-containing protein [Candidatus Bathyarchaeia archaeon]
MTTIVKDFALRLTTNLGFTKIFDKGDNYARESHFERSGVDSSYTDACDVFYFAGHGSYRGFQFSTNYDRDGTYN